ncbi:MAG: LssY C-terminal domain-containing protein [Candidatus Omnitrophota bacterium]
MNFTGKQNPFLCSFLILSLVFSGCVRYRPQLSDRSSFMARAQTKTQGNVTVTVSVLSNKESKKVFGVELAKKGVQPVWVEIDNQSPNFYYVFIPRNMDPNYYSAEEAAYMAHFKQSKLFFESGLLSVIFLPIAILIPINFFVVGRANKRMTSLFNENSLPATTVMPKTKESGFVFASVDQGTKHVKIDLIGDETREIFNFVVPVPGIKPDYTTQDFANRYSKDAIVEYTDKDFPKYLEQLPCCVTNKKGTRTGDPLNLVVIGEFEDLITIFGFSSWDETSALTPSSGLSMAKAFLTGENDRYSPISPLYYHGHPQDIAFQKTRNSINQRLHFRLWYTPIRYNGKPVWMGAISRDIGVKFTFTTWYLTTHRIDPNLDDSRDYLFAELIEMEKVSKYGFVENIALEQPGHKNKNLTNDPYFTDNQRLVIELSVKDTPFTPFPWERPSKDETSKKT